MNKKQELETELKNTLNLLLAIANEPVGLILKVDKPTADEIFHISIPYKYEIEISLISDDELYPYKKNGKALYKWIWTIPSQKRSYSGRIIK